MILMNLKFTGELNLSNYNCQAKEMEAMRKARKIMQYDLNLNPIKSFKSVEDASNETGICKTLIYECVHRNVILPSPGIITKKDTGGFIWKYLEEET